MSIFLLTLWIISAVVAGLWWFNLIATIFSGVLLILFLASLGIFGAGLAEGLAELGESVGDGLGSIDIDFD